MVATGRVLHVCWPFDTSFLPSLLLSSVARQSMVSAVVSGVGVGSKVIVECIGLFCF